MVGYTQELYDNLEQYSSNSYLYSDDIPSLSLTYGTSPSISDKASQLAIRGGFGRINYNYKEKVSAGVERPLTGLPLSERCQIQSSIPVFLQPGVLSKENFWMPIETYVNTFKFRVSSWLIG